MGSKHIKLFSISLQKSVLQWSAAKSIGVRRHTTRQQHTAHGDTAHDKSLRQLVPQTNEVWTDPPGIFLW